MLHDALLVLGYNNDPTHPVFQARVEKAVQLYDAGYAQQLIMSGCCSMTLDIRPRLTEAAAMSDYAVSLGVPAAAILLEEESVDTLGNFYFTKKNILLACSWYNIGFVSTPAHVTRSEWLADQLLGPDFDVTGYASDIPKGWSDDDIAASNASNERLLRETQDQLKDMTPGDHEYVNPFLGTAPPGG